MAQEKTQKSSDEQLLAQEVSEALVAAGGALSEDQKKLVDRVAALTQTKGDLEKKYERLEHQFTRLEEERRDFASIVSHDLKAPLRGISTIVDWLKEEEGSKMDSQGQEYLDLLKERSKQVYTMIDEVLTHSRLIEGNRELGELDLKQLLTSVRNGFSQVTNLYIKVPQPVPIKGNSVLMREVFHHLLDNAIKFSDKEKIIVKIDVVESADFYQFSVTDNGPGIPEKHHDKIFKIFQTFDNRSGGLGIGLAHVKKIVMSAGGKIWVESNKGTGTAFHFTWPKQIDQSELR